MERTRGRAPALAATQQQRAGSMCARRGDPSRRAVVRIFAERRSPAKRARESGRFFRSPARGRS